MKITLAPNSLPAVARFGRSGRSGAQIPTDRRPGLVLYWRNNRYRALLRGGPV